MNHDNDTPKKPQRRARVKAVFITRYEILNARKLLGISQREAAYIFCGAWDKSANWAAWESGANGMPRQIAAKVKRAVLELQRRTALAHIRVGTALEEAYRHTDEPRIVLVSYEFTPSSKAKNAKNITTDAYQEYFKNYLDWVIIRAMNLSLATRFLEAVLVTFNSEEFDDWCIEKNIPVHEKNDSKTHHRWAQDFALQQGWLLS